MSGPATEVVLVQDPWPRLPRLAPTLSENFIPFRPCLQKQHRVSGSDPGNAMPSLGLPGNCKRIRASFCLTVVQTAVRNLNEKIEKSCPEDNHLLGSVSLAVVYQCENHRRLGHF